MNRQGTSKAWKLLLLLSALALGPGCGAQPEALELTPPPSVAPLYTTVYKNGRYTATAPGYGGEVSVTITVVEDVVTLIEVQGESETRGVGSVAIERMPERILAAQGGQADVVSGATETSNAIKQAYAAALEKARNPIESAPAVLSTPAAE